MIVLTEEDLLLLTECRTYVHAWPQVRDTLAVRFSDLISRLSAQARDMKLKESINLSTKQVERSCEKSK